MSHLLRPPSSVLPFSFLSSPSPNARTRALPHSLFFFSIPLHDLPFASSFFLVLSSNVHSSSSLARLPSTSHPLLFFFLLSFLLFYQPSSIPNRFIFLVLCLFLASLLPPHLIVLIVVVLKKKKPNKNSSSPILFSFPFPLISTSFRLHLLIRLQTTNNRPLSSFLSVCVQVCDIFSFSCLCECRAAPSFPEAPLQSHVKHPVAV